MEMSGSSSHGTSTVRTWHSDSGTIVAEHTMFHHDLRVKVAQGLGDLTLSHPDGYSAQVWINGLGEVVETSVDPCGSVADPRAVVFDLQQLAPSSFLVFGVHSKDSMYRRFPRINPNPRSGCIFSNWKRFFPFPHSIEETH